MASDPLRLVLDTNVLLAGLVSGGSASQKIVDALQRRRLVPLLSAPVLSEYRTILTHPAVRERFPHLTPRRVEVAIRRLRYVGDEYRPIRIRFELPRDPQDAMFIELAIAGRATHLITMDADLLSLTASHSDAAKRLRQRAGALIVQTPQALLQEWKDDIAASLTRGE